MVKFKTLIRKSDGQWMEISSELYTPIYEVNAPVHMDEDLLKYWKKRIFDDPIDWSLYELIEVAVIRMDDVPDENEINDFCEATYRRASEFYKMKQAINWFKNKIFKP